MNAFIVFSVFTYFLIGLIELLTGLLIWRKFKDDFEVRTLAGILIVQSPIFLLIAFRILLWDLGWIDKDLSFYIFFFEYIYTFPAVFLFTFPRFAYLVFKRPIAKKIGWVFSGIIVLLYVIIHLSLRAEIIPHYSPIGLLFEIPALEKKVFFFTSIFILPLIIQRVVFHFRQWRKTKTFPYKFLEYLFLSFSLFMASVAITPPSALFDYWRALLGFIVMLAGVLGFYFIASQELIKKEEMTLVFKGERGEEEEKADRLERLRKLKIELSEEVEKSKRKIGELVEKEIERLKKEKE